MLTAVTPNVTLKDIVMDYTTSGLALTDRNLMRHHQFAVEKILGADRDLSGLLDAVGIKSDWQPTPEVVGAEIGAMEFDEARMFLKEKQTEFAGQVADHFIKELADGQEKLRVGRISWNSDRSCVFTFFEKKVSRSGLLTMEFNISKNTHHLLRARRHRLPAPGVFIPKEAQRIIKKMPAWLKKHGYIVTGDRIVKQSELAGQESERTALGRAFDSAKEQGGKAKDAAKKHAGKIAAGFAATAALVGAGIIASMQAAGPVVATAVVADPALVLGEYVFCGWD